jgi:hypothetical protein
MIGTAYIGLSGCGIFHVSKIIVFFTMLFNCGSNPNNTSTEFGLNFENYCAF